MQKIELAYENVGYFSTIILDYINEKESLAPFYKYATSINEFNKVIEDKVQDNTDREALVDILKHQNHSFISKYDFVDKNVNALLSQKTFTITTGHQLCIAGGPLYFIYKVVSVINLCNSLKEAYPKNNFVPIFWLASEDHGEGEISKINLFGKTLEWNYKEKGASGKRSTSPYQSINAELIKIIGEDNNGLEILDLFQKSYSESADLAEATRSYLYKLFGEYGLVVIDGDNKKLKHKFLPIMKDEIENSSTMKNVTETATKLGKQYKIQAHARDINLFYLEDGVRERIVKSEDGFAVMNSEIKFSKNEILTKLNTHPEKFSPNVLLRPLYQEKVLPNLAYIGGPGETAYWLQLKSHFEYHNINFPMVVLRDSAQWIDAKSTKKLEKLKIGVDEIFQPIAQLKKQYLEKHSDEFSLTEYSDKLHLIFDELADVISKIDKSLKGSVEGERAKQTKRLQTIENKAIKALKRKYEVELNQLQKLKEKLFPNGGLQERHENFIPYYIKYGKEFIPILLKNLDVLNKRLTVFIEEE